MEFTHFNEDGHARMVDVSEKKDTAIAQSVVRMQPETLQAIKRGEIRKGDVLAVNISKIKGIPKQAIDKGYFAVDCGLRGDAHAGKWHRQVSLLGNESIHKMEELGLGKLATGSLPRI